MLNWIAAILFFCTAALAHADCVPYEDVAVFENFGDPRTVTLQGRLGLNDMATDFLVANQDHQNTPMYRSVAEISITFTPNTREISDPIRAGQTICLPEQFTLDIPDDAILVKAHKLVRTRALVKVKGLLTVPTSSIEIINNGLMTDVEIQ